MWKFSDHLAQYGVELKGTYLLLILIIYQSGLLGRQIRIAMMYLCCRNMDQIVAQQTMLVQLTFPLMLNSEQLHTGTKLDGRIESECQSYSLTPFRLQGVGAVRGKELIHEVCPDSKSSTLTTLIAVVSMFANNNLLSKEDIHQCPCAYQTNINQGFLVHVTCLLCK